MISLRFIRRHDSIRAFRVTGHAGQAAKGRDIVCAAVSALSESCVNGLLFAGIPTAYAIADGRLSCYVHPRTDAQALQAAALLDALWLAARQIQAQYPTYVRTIDTQWR